MRNFAPQSQQFNERLVVREQKSFSDGAYDDIPGLKVPKFGVKFLENYVILPDGTIETRPGTRKWSFLALPAMPGRTGLSITKSGTTVTAGSPYFATADEGNYLVYDDGKHELITNVPSAGSHTATVEGSTAHAASSAAYIRGAIYGGHYHKGKDRIILHLGTRLYVCDGALTASPGWVECVPIGPYSIGASATKFDEINNKVVAFNASGIFTIDLDFNPDTVTFQYCYYQTNTAVPSVPVADSIDNNQYKYKYRYLYTFSRIRGAGIAGDRTTSGAVVDQESGPVGANASTQIDYGTVYTEKPIGPSTIVNGTLTGRALAAPWNTIEVFSEITDGQFTATFDGVSQNIVVDFTGVESWTDIAEVLQVALRDYFEYATVEFVTDHFVFTNKVDSGTIGHIESGTGGTDIGGDLGSGKSILRCCSTIQAELSPPDFEGILDTPYIDAPYSAVTGTSEQLQVAYQQDHWTHYSVYRTLDLGVNGMDPQTGQGNNKELYVWVMDVPIQKVFRCTLTASGSNWRVTADTYVFSKDDIGSKIVFSIAGVNNYGTIILLGTQDDPAGTLNSTQCYVSGTLQTVGAGTVPTKVAGAIGVWDYSLASSPPQYTPACFRAYQSGTTLTLVKDTVASSPAGIENNFMFAGDETGRVIFWEDGSISVLTAYVSPTVYTVQWSATHGSAGTPLAVCLKPYSRGFSDRITDAVLRARTAKFALRNRFWTPLPTGACGTIEAGYLAVATRGGTVISYCQLPTGLEYLYGYHRSDDQIITVKDLITALDHVQSMLIAYCYNTILSVPLNTYREEKREELGETIIVLMGQTVVSPDIGCIDFGSIRNIDGYRHVFLTSNNELRLLEYTGSGVTISENLAKDRYAKLLVKSIGCAAVSYDRFNGVILWLRTVVSGLDAGAPLTGQPTDVSYRQALSADQGVGWMKNSGNAWVMPAAQIGNLMVYDSSKVVHSIVLDNTDGFFYNISQRAGATSSTATKVWKDKVAVDGSGGTDIICSVLFGEDAGAAENQFIQLLESHFGIRAADESNRNQTGYGTDGILTGTTFDLDVFADGEPTTPTLQNVDVVKIGDIIPDEIARAHSLQIKLTANKGAHRIVSRLQKYEIQDIADTPENCTTTEMDNQQALATPLLWVLALNGVVKDLATGETMAGAYKELATGPDGNQSAIKMTGQAGLTPVSALSLSGDFSLLIFLENITATSAIIAIGWLTISVVKDGSVYSITWADGTNTVTQQLGWDGTGVWGVQVTRSGSNLIIREGVNA